MLVPIFIDTSSILDQYSEVTHGQVDALCDNIAKTLAARYAQKLEQEANSALHQTRKRYVNNIHVIDSGKLEGTVILDFSKDPLIRMLEEGASPFDMKEGLLNSSKVKISKNGGRYITVPFRIGTPGVVGDSDVFSGIMPQEVYDVIKNKDTNIGGSRSAGLTVKELPTQYQSKATRAAIKDSAGKVLFEQYTHKNPIYEGMTKDQDAVTGQNTYNSFRRVSDQLRSPDGKVTGSDPNAWIHPGIERHNLVQKALENFDQEREITIALTNEFEKLGLI